MVIGAFGGARFVLSPALGGHGPYRRASMRVQTRGGDQGCGGGAPAKILSFDAPKHRFCKEICACLTFGKALENGGKLDFMHATHEHEQGMHMHMHMR